MAEPQEIKEDSNGPRAQIIMKFDSPEESDDNSISEKSEENSMESNMSPIKPVNKISHPILAASKFGKSCEVDQVSNTNQIKAPILRPSQLGKIGNASGISHKTILQPAKFQNPFTKVTDDAILDDVTSTVEKEDTSTKDSKSTNDKPLQDVKHKFLPLGASTKENNTSHGVHNTVTPSASNPSFVFGQNLKERVTVPNDTETSNSSNKEETKSEESNNSSELLFSNAAKLYQTPSRTGLTLTEAAQELEEAHKANKRKYNQVALLTGEEGETNVLQINCKLFTFDKTTSGWQERGRGTLRLNDLDEESRLVGRTAGTQRLILNTKVWPGMTAERAGAKSLRLTAMDVNGDIRIFLVQAASKEVDQLYNLLLQRLKRAIERQPKKLATDH